MDLFAYSKDWANLVTAQLAQSHRTDNPSEWGYACLCISDIFNPTFRDHFETIDKITGKHLHIFTLYPPPLSFVLRRHSELHQAESSPDDYVYGAQHLRVLYKRAKILRAYQDNPSQFERERNDIVNDLMQSGLRVPLETQFLFFDIRKMAADEYEIDIVVAHSTHLSNDSNRDDFLHFFEDLGRKATEAFEQRISVEGFIKKLTFKWNLIRLTNASLDMYKYLAEFLKKIIP